MMLNNLGGTRRERETLYMWVYVNTLAYLCKLRNAYNVTINVNGGDGGRAGKGGRQDMMMSILCNFRLCELTTNIYNL